VSVFRPSARLTAPDGREWEIYAYKLEVGDRGEWDTDLLDEHGPYPGTVAAASAVFAIVNAVVWLVMLIPRLLLRLVDIGIAAVRAARSDTWTIQAITFMPQHETYTWKTTSEYRGQVLAQVQGSLQRGDVPQHLRNATYVGWSRSAR
jgi:hypothetical protein